MNSCSQCGTENPKQAVHCVACGAQLLHEENPASESRKVVTVACCAIHDFDELTERLDPEVLAEIVAAYSGSMQEVLERYGATVMQWGNNILGLFGIPQVHADDA